MVVAGTETSRCTDDGVADGHGRMKAMDRSEEDATHCFLRDADDEECHSGRQTGSGADGMKEETRKQEARMKRQPANEVRGASEPEPLRTERPAMIGR